MPHGAILALEVRLRPKEAAGQKSGACFSSRVWLLAEASPIGSTTKSRILSRERSSSISGWPPRARTQAHGRRLPKASLSVVQRDATDCSPVSFHARARIAALGMSLGGRCIPPSIRVHRQLMRTEKDCNDGEDDDHTHDSALHTHTLVNRTEPSSDIARYVRARAYISRRLAKREAASSTNRRAQSAQPPPAEDPRSLNPGVAVESSL
jgi:hypothetical protein